MRSWAEFLPIHCDDGRLDLLSKTRALDLVGRRVHLDAQHLVCGTPRERA